MEFNTIELIIYDPVDTRQPFGSNFEAVNNTSRHKCYLPYDFSRFVLRAVRCIFQSQRKVHASLASISHKIIVFFDGWLSLRLHLISFS